MTDSHCLFDARYIDQDILKQVPEGFRLRPLETTDYEKGFLNVLTQLTVVGTLSKDEFMTRYNDLKKHDKKYFTVVVEDLTNHQIIGCCTLFIEHKFIHNLGKVGHLEDAVTLETYRGKQFGRLLIQSLMSVGKNLGCYKVILDCKMSNVAFYEKCGLKINEVQMVKYYVSSKPKL